MRIKVPSTRHRLSCGPTALQSKSMPVYARDDLPERSACDCLWRTWSRQPDHPTEPAIWRLEAPSAQGCWPRHIAGVRAPIARLDAPCPDKPLTFMPQLQAVRLYGFATALWLWYGDTVRRNATECDDLRSHGISISYEVREASGLFGMGFGV
jgi:hypothetical protein